MTIFKNLKFCKQDILSYQPDVVILVDYPGFNMRIAKWAKTQNLKVVYYISPQVWAWKQGRVKTIKNVVDKMLVILPFEKEFYQKWNYPVSYVGHPLADVVAEAESAPQKSLELELAERFDKDKPTVALLPGSLHHVAAPAAYVRLPVLTAKGFDEIAAMQIAGCFA